MNYKDFYNKKSFNAGYYGVTAIIYYLTAMFELNPELGFLPYNDELNKKESFESILITSKYDWETKYREKRPAIFVSRGNLNTGVNNTNGIGKLLSKSDTGEITTYTDLISYPIVVECLSESDIECEAIASMVSIFLSFDTTAINSLGLQTQGTITQSPPQLFEKANVSFISSVIMQLQIQRKYRATVLGREALQKIQLKLNESTIINIEKE